jgi:hypothetical protein
VGAFYFALLEEGMDQAAINTADAKDESGKTPADGNQQGDPAQSQPDYKSEANRAQQLYTGLQGRFKQTQEGLEEANKQNAELLDRLIVAEGQVAGQPDEAIGAARANLKNDLDLSEAQSGLRQQEERLRTVAAQIGPFIMDQEIQTKYGVALKDLSDALGWEQVKQMAPQEIRTAATLLGRQSKEKSAGRRQQSGADQFEAGGGSVASNPKSWGTDTIKAGLIQRDEAAANQ